MANHPEVEDLARARNVPLDVHSIDATTRSAEDKKKIDDYIAATIGHEKLDKLLTKQLKKATAAYNRKDVAWNMCGLGIYCPVQAICCAKMGCECGENSCYTNSGPICDCCSILRSPEDWYDSGLNCCGCGRCCPCLANCCPCPALRAEDYGATATPIVCCMKVLFPESEASMIGPPIDQWCCLRPSEDFYPSADYCCGWGRCCPCPAHYMPCCSAADYCDGKCRGLPLCFIWQCWPEP